MRRERNQYIFASELTKRNRSHRFRNAVLLLLPILIVSYLRIEKTVHLQDICFIDWFVFGDFIKKVVRFGMPGRLVDITKWFATYC